VTELLAPPAPAEERPAGSGPAPHGPGARLWRIRWPLAVGAVLAGALGLRLWGITHGLPFAYHGDENAHFVPLAVRFATDGDFNPGYFVNPPGYTELLYLVFALRYGVDGMAETFKTDPASLILTARVVSAVTGTAAVGLLYLATARFFDRRVGLLAAGLLAVVFVPVYYGHQALNDSPSLALLALALLGAALILRRGRPADYIGAGLALGLAVGVKYTCGIALFPIAAAGLVQLLGGRWKGALIGAALAAAACLVGFFLTNPYGLLDLDTFLRDLERQRVAAAGARAGEPETNGLRYYGWVLTWGFGWVPAIASAIGAALLARANWRVALVLLPAPLIMILFMSGQARFFARYVLPIFPFLCVLAAYAGIRGVEAARRFGPRLVPVAAVLVVLALGGQAAVGSVHNDVVLSRADTRNQTRQWLLTNLAPGTPIVLEPVIPKHRRENGLRWLSPRAGGSEALRVRSAPRRKYERTLNPALIDTYIRQGYCWVVTGSTQIGLAAVGPRRRPVAMAYYAALERRADIAYRATPFAPDAPAAPGREAVPFQWDWSADYFPRAYERPGPVMTVYRLREGRCASAPPAGARASLPPRG
jgi:4-amino-4-deoxy-L-arabinose transferase-like glycosyltransferase